MMHSDNPYSFFAVCLRILRRNVCFGANEAYFAHIPTAMLRRDGVWVQFFEGQCVCLVCGVYHKRRQIPVFDLDSPKNREYRGTARGNKYVALDPKRLRASHERRKQKTHQQSMEWEHQKELFVENVAKSTKKVAYVSYSMKYQKDCI